jgi:hypothetical protein
VLIALRHTITIRANITAYSTAVGPSSETMNRRSFKAKLFIAFLHDRQRSTAITLDDGAAALTR